jgi:carbon monoxide dehydrogenase subunit G
MAELHNEIRIDAPLERVWEVLANLEAVQHYNPGVTRARYLSSQREGVGASRECEMKPKGRVRERVIGWEPGKAITMELYASDWPIRYMRWRTALEADGAGTRVTQRMDYQLKFGVLGAILDRLVMRRKLGGIIQETFQQLRRYVETGSARARVG